MEVRTHSHPLFIVKRDNGWACDGRHQNGGCFKGCTNFGQTKGWKRYRCREMTCDYDLCEPCANNHCIYQQPTKLPSSVNVTCHTHQLYLQNDNDNGWACDGKNQSRHCARGCTGFRQSYGWVRYRCIDCDFDLCDLCALKYYSKTIEVTTPLHTHPLTKCFRDNGWACDGKNLPGGCKQKCTGFGQTAGWTRYRCKKCDFDLCESCLKEHKIQTERNIHKKLQEVKEEVSDENLCCICMDEAKNAVVVHGESSHFCCCYPCAVTLKQKKGGCPICRASIDNIFFCYSS